MFRIAYWRSISRDRGEFYLYITCMTDNRKSGIALIAGSVGILVTMAVHPVGARTMTPELVEHLALTSALAHSLAMLSVAALVLGAFGLTQRLHAPDRAAFSGLVFFCFAAIAIFIAAAVSGFIEPRIMRHMTRDAAAAGPQWLIVIDAIFQINQAFARIYTVAAAIAMGLWSCAALRNGGMSGKMAFYGIAMAVVLIAVMCSGYLPLNVHGMGAVVLAQAIWFVGVGWGLCRNRVETQPQDLGAAV